MSLIILISSFLISNIVSIVFMGNFEFYKLFFVLFISSIISWFISKLFDWICAEKVNTNDKAVLITGCDSGFGNQLAKRCDELGFNVFAGVLHPGQSGAQQLKNVCSEKLRIIEMDVTKYEDVVNAFNQIKYSGLNLWAVVNNAGISVTAPIEWGYDVKQLTDIFNVNVLGAVRVAKLSLPLLRQSNGRIVNISSLAGIVT